MAAYGMQVVEYAKLKVGWEYEMADKVPPRFEN
jgi:hypothetical protein